ncbi:MAG TPA: winged helix-turn-helix domain-containing protein [Woeseiaceae bacterium]|nr:winged helix-turn-helix domain-containing protein [Woeseiaceae bacterium]
MKNAGVGRRYRFEAFRFDAGTGELCNPAESIKLRPQASRALELLLSRRGELLTKDELRQALWPDERIVMFESSIAAVMRELRRALGDDPKSPRFIETIPKRGYRFLPPPGVPEARDARRRHGARGTAGGFLNLSQGLAVALVVLLPNAIEKIPALASARTAEPVTVTVLPFESLAPPLASLSGDLSRELVGWLGHAAPETLRVIDATGRRTGDAAPSDLVLQGSVRAVEDGPGEAVVVSVRLLSGADGAFVWGEDYPRRPGEPAVVAREVSARIADRVLSSALPGWSTGYGEPAGNQDAAEHYRRGLDSLEQFSPQAVAGAVEDFAEAIRLDPGFDAAHARFAEALIHWMGPARTAERVEQARQAASRAIQLEPRNAVAYRVLGEIGLFVDRDWQLAGRHLEQSVRLSPSAAPGHHSYALWLSSRGRQEEALREIRLAEALDSGSIAISIDAMLLHFYARDFEGTVTAARRLQQLWPGSQSAHRYVVLSRLATGDAAGAADEARAVLGDLNATLADSRLITAMPDGDVLEAYWTASLGAVQRWVQEDGGDPSFLSFHYLQLGQQDAALHSLETAIADARFSYLLPFLGVSPAYDSLCGNQRFERILRDLRQSALTVESVDSRCDAAMQAAAPRAARAAR